MNERENRNADKSSARLHAAAGEAETYSDASASAACAQIAPEFRMLAFALAKAQTGTDFANGGPMQLSKCKFFSSMASSRSSGG